mgnify:FL=1|tara:strand:+ start:149 stop:430 length:282 start_codon:yes stop_codon:yes gene_type:complete
MRLKKEMVELISDKLTSSLLDEEFIIFTEDSSKLKEIIADIIIEDLMIEDKLDEEVKKIITSHANEMDTGNVDHRRMFQMIKKKLIRERDLVL